MRSVAFLQGNGSDYRNRQELREGISIRVLEQLTLQDTAPARCSSWKMRGKVIFPFFFPMPVTAVFADN